MEETVRLRFKDGSEIEHAIETEAEHLPVKCRYVDETGTEHWFMMKNGDDDMALYVEFPDSGE